MSLLEISHSVSAALVRCEDNKKFCVSCRTKQPADTFVKTRHGHGVYVKCSQCTERTKKWSAAR